MYYWNMIRKKKISVLYFMICGIFMFIVFKGMQRPIPPLGMTMQLIPIGQSTSAYP